MKVDPMKDAAYLEFMTRVYKPVFSKAQVMAEIRAHRDDLVAAYVGRIRSSK